MLSKFRTRILTCGSFVEILSGREMPYLNFLLQLSIIRPPMWNTFIRQSCACKVKVPTNVCRQSVNYYCILKIKLQLSKGSYSISN